ncbi:MAG TPA: hypothetical protein VMY77_05335 [Chitinophagaceae bacterium]|nr:hypothetical protein [Chitinophagaceae bacterium]
METHHPHHVTHKKRWTEYLLEFFMLFLAVFLGFVAENYREHIVEHQREKQFMRSMVEDLQTDTAEMTRILNDINTRSQNVDSMLSLLVTPRITNDVIIKSYHFTFPALNNLSVVFDDRTITQLKSSGSMRMIRNQKVNDALVKYWNHIEVVNKALERHTAYRTKGRDMETRIFNTAEIFVKNNRKIANPSEPVNLINNETNLIKEYTNVIAYCGVMLTALNSQIVEQHRLADGLIQLIKKEYHLK